MIRRGKEKAMRSLSNMERDGVIQLPSPRCIKKDVTMDTEVTSGVKTHAGMRSNTLEHVAVLNTTGQLHKPHHHDHHHRG